MSNNQFINKEIKWRTTSIYVDVETGEIIPEEIAKEKYIIINKTKQSNVYKSTGITTITNECKRSTQLKLF